MTGEEILESPTDWVATHVRQYVASDGRQGHLRWGIPNLLITTRGRRTGKLRRTALVYGRDGDRYILVASNGGAPKHPLWYLNLVEHPDVTVQVGAESFAARARTATADEKATLWKVMVSILPAYQGYQDKAGREIPVVIVERQPVGSGPVGSGPGE